MSESRHAAPPHKAPRFDPSSLEGASNWDYSPARTSRAGAFLKYLFLTGLGLATLSLACSVLGIACGVASFFAPLALFGFAPFPLGVLAMILAFLSVRFDQNAGGSVLISFAAIGLSLPLVFLGFFPFATRFFLAPG